MFKKTFLTTLAIAMIALFSIQTSTALAGANDHRVRARLDGPALASGKSVYRERMRGNALEQRFKVQIEDAIPGEAMQVRLNGMLIGTIVTDALGRGEMQLRTVTFIDDPGDGTPIPSDFPTVVAGDEVTVGPLAGTYGDD